MALSAAQVKGRIKSLAERNGMDPRVLMRMFMMERFLERVSESENTNWNQSTKCKACICGIKEKGCYCLTELVVQPVRMCYDLHETKDKYVLNIV